MRALHKERPALGAGMACACLAALCLGGCSLAPKYERPDAPVAATCRITNFRKVTCPPGWDLARPPPPGRRIWA